MIPAEHKLWFTGEEWADGTAHHFLRQQFELRVRQYALATRSVRMRSQSKSGLSVDTSDPVSDCDQQARSHFSRATRKSPPQARVESD
jgi:hypothetical protein